MAAGVSVTWGVLRIINLAHFGMILLGAYLTFELATTWRIDPLVTVVVTVPAMFASAPLLQWAFDRLGIAELNSLLFSFGLLIVIVQAVSNIWSADFQRMTASVNPYATGRWRSGRWSSRYRRCSRSGSRSRSSAADISCSSDTFLGRAMRAFAQDRTVAAAFGIDHRRHRGAAGRRSAGATAAVAGMLFALANALTPATAFEWFGTVFAVVILGGIGHLLGTLVAGLRVGLVSGVVSVVLSPAAAPFVLFSAIVLALLLRPQGLFAAQVRRDDPAGPWSAFRSPSVMPRDAVAVPGRPSGSRCSTWLC